MCRLTAWDGYARIYIAGAGRAGARARGPRSDAPGAYARGTARAVRREGAAVRIEIDYSTFTHRDKALARIKQLRGSGIKASLLEEDPPLTWQPRPFVVRIDTGVGVGE